MIHADSPRCCDCAYPLEIIGPMTVVAGQYMVCPQCRTHLIARRAEGRWAICTVAEHRQQRTAPLPAITPKAGRHRVRGAALAVLRFLRPCEGVEPGESSL